MEIRIWASRRSHLLPTDFTLFSIIRRLLLENRRTRIKRVTGEAGVARRGSIFNSLSAFPPLFIGIARSSAIGGLDSQCVFANVCSRTFFKARLISY